MPATVEELEAQALRLAPDERVRLADRLLASLSADPEVDDAWAAEIERRLAELDSGQAEAVPLEEAIARARAAIR
jgi:putative addiction module component (TIGR02574 family)